jgi:hypothetical protein
MALVQLTYVSAAARELGPDDLQAILESSVRRNAAVGITGLLLYSEGGFMQVLEGDAAPVDATMARIVADPRHAGVIVLARRPIGAREFATWSMGFRRLGRDDAAEWPGYAPFFENGFDARAPACRPGAAVDLLRTFGRSDAGGRFAPRAR